MNLLIFQKKKNVGADDPKAVKNVRHALAGLILKETIEKGKTIKIPSLGIEINTKKYEEDKND